MADVAVLLGKAGFILFTAGLALGIIIPRFKNPRMGLSAHLTAVQGGLVLLVFALFWPNFGIGDWASAPIAFSLAVSTYLLVAGLILAAITGASRALPIAGEGFKGSPSKEMAVWTLTVGSSIWMLMACIAVCLFFLRV
jgi:(hydroxyamino)benzene mutase